MERNIRTFQVMVNGFPAGTICPRPGSAMGFPPGFDPTGSWEQAEASPAKAAATTVATNKRILTGVSRFRRLEIFQGL